MPRLLIACYIICAFTLSVDAISAEVKGENKVDASFVKPLVLEIPEDEFFIFSLHKLDGVRGEFEASVYLTLKSVACNDPHVTSQKQLSVGEAFFPLMPDGPRLKQANSIKGFAVGGPFQFLQFTQGRSKLTGFICEDKKTDDGKPYGLWQGEFELKGSHRWDTTYYPFDRQVLRIEFETPMAADLFEFKIIRKNMASVPREGYLSSVIRCWKEGELNIDFFTEFDTCMLSNDPHRDLNFFIKDWRVISTKARAYKYDYKSCFGYQCNKKVNKVLNDCENALEDMTLSRTQKENACVRVYSRYSLEVGIERNQSWILPIIFSLGPIFLLLVAFRMHPKRVQRNQTGVGSIALFATGYFGYVTQIGPVHFPSLFSIFAIFFIVCASWFFFITSNALIDND